MISSGKKTFSGHLKSVQIKVYDVSVEVWVFTGFVYIPGFYVLHRLKNLRFS